MASKVAVLTPNLPSVSAVVYFIAFVNKVC
jgi:hypothetical protein